MKKLKLTAAQMVHDARARINEIETADLIAKLDDPNLIIIDIRDIRERQKTGFIPGSYHAPRGMIEFWVDPESPYFKPIFGRKRQTLCLSLRLWLAVSIECCNAPGYGI